MTDDPRDLYPFETVYAMREYVRLAYGHHVTRERVLSYASSWAGRCADAFPSHEFAPAMHAFARAAAREWGAAGTPEQMIREVVTDTCFDVLCEMAGFEPFFFRGN